MKDMDGYTFVQELQHEDLLKSIPVIILTGYQDMKDLFSMKEIADYILKPFDNEDLLLRISRAIQK
jgi:response regulator RpfG family c-di-GMP phosphodiesterase